MFPEPKATARDTPTLQQEARENLPQTNLQPKTAEEVQEAVRSHSQLVPRGGSSKPALSTPPEGVPNLDLCRLSGVIEYDPAEFTFIARAGTPVSEVEALLAEHGQFLPFDPIMVKSGATLGGTVAAGTSGPGCYRYGGVRDFLLGIRFVTGEAELVQGGSKVVKNAAGFDLPRLMVGSLGHFGILVELIFKVFPKPESYVTLRADCPGLEEALEVLYRLSTSSFDLEALDLEPSGKIWVRLAGRAESLASRVNRLRNVLGNGRTVEGPEEESLWQAIREFVWLPSDWSLVKVPLTPSLILALEERLGETEAHRRYSLGGNMAWLAWPGELEGLESILNSLDLAGLVLVGSPGRSRLGTRTGEAFAQRVKKALDPQGRFL
ncbi:FAD-binding protein [Acidobacteria bacterium AH-259-O06]|nr:FAD-binding protein [Acidobacteria bacterium AH-259-O06]